MLEIGSFFPFLIVWIYTLVLWLGLFNASQWRSEVYIYNHWLWAGLCDSFTQQYVGRSYSVPVLSRGFKQHHLYFLNPLELLHSVWVPERNVYKTDLHTMQVWNQAQLNLAEKNHRHSPPVELGFVVLSCWDVEVIYWRRKSCWRQQWITQPVTELVSRKTWTWPLVFWL